uniref:SEP domain-containing protein n=1 Tax=Kalanchoe fedtschenkoi TaxID=63787 RepID=A0A7N0TAY6_KALFE
MRSGGDGIERRRTMEKTEESNNEALIRSFSEITSAAREEALFFLESHNWDLDSAVSTYFDSSATTNAAAAPAGPQPVLPPSPDSPPILSPSRSDSSQRSRSESPPRSPYRLRSRQDKQKLPMGSSSKSTDKGNRSGGIRTLADLNRSAKDDSDSDSDEPQEYYTGGEKSGMLVQDPTRGRDVDTIFDQARQAGVAQGQGDSVRPTSSSRSFTGTGRLLSGETVAAAPAQDQQPEPLTHTIYFWRNGFSVDDGPVRRMDDPQNAPFLEVSF